MIHSDWLRTAKSIPALVAVGQLHEHITQLPPSPIQQSGFRLESLSSSILELLMLIVTILSQAWVFSEDLGSNSRSRSLPPVLQNLRQRLVDLLGLQTSEASFHTLVCCNWHLLDVTAPMEIGNMRQTFCVYGTLPKPVVL